VNGKKKLINQNDLQNDLQIGIRWDKIPQINELATKHLVVFLLERLL
jgi:hypothetical protein